MAKEPTKKQPRAKSRSQLLRAEEQYNETGDFRYVALAIGRYRAGSVPKWALDACGDYYERWELNYLTPITAKKWLMPRQDRFGAFLDEMADYILDKYDTDGKLAELSKATIHAAAVYAARAYKYKEHNAVVQRVTRAWNQEREYVADVLEGNMQNHITMHPRIERAYFRNKQKKSS